MKILNMLHIKLHLHHSLILAFLICSACAQAETTTKETTTVDSPIESVTTPTMEEVVANDAVTPDELPATESDAVVDVVTPKVQTEAKETTKPQEVTQLNVATETVEEAPVMEEITTDAPTVTETAPVTEVIPDPAPQTAPSHKIWDGLLTKYVSAAGVVDYAAMKSNKDILQSYLDLLADNPPRGDWSRNERMAYWINAYNAFTVKMIIDNYPVNSIKDLYGGKPWDVKWIKIGDRTYSLNQIENDILRPIFKDARIHFAVNCAATSCPPLYNHAFTASGLNGQLEQQTSKFINNPSYNMLKADAVEVSKIFDWYSSDFGGLLSYLNEYSNTSINSNADISFMNYDWRLNGK